MSPWTVMVVVTGAGFCAAGDGFWIGDCAREAMVRVRIGIAVSRKPDRAAAH